VWRKAQPGTSLGALRSLLPGGRGHPHGSPAALAALPLFLRAYPFAAAKARSDALWLHDVYADEPTDIGSSILNESGLPTRGTEQRLAAAAGFQAGIEATRDMTRQLLEEDAFEPWPLDLEAEGQSLKMEDLFVIRPAVMDSVAMVRFVRRFGTAGARLISAHALSLFRAGVLYQRAKQALAPAS
jgi:hypothetical protein